MLRRILFSLLVVLTFSVANSGEGIGYKEENRVLKLKLKIYELKAENKELKKVIDDLSLNSKEERARELAIVKLKRELRMSRRSKR